MNQASACAPMAGKGGWGNGGGQVVGVSPFSPPRKGCGREYRTENEHRIRQGLCVVM